MVHKKPRGQNPHMGEDHGQNHGAEDHQGIEADVRQIQPPGMTVHGSRVEQQQQEPKGHQTISVVPVIVRNDPKEEDQPGQSGGGRIPEGEGQPRKKTILQGRLQKPVKPPKNSRGQVDNHIKQAAEKTVWPAPGHDALPAKGLEDGAFVDLAAAPGAAPDGQPVEPAVLIGGQEEE